MHEVANRSGLADGKASFEPRWASSVLPDLHQDTIFLPTKLSGPTRPKQSDLFWGLGFLESFDTFLPFSHAHVNKPTP